MRNRTIIAIGVAGMLAAACSSKDPTGAGGGGSAGSGGSAADEKGARLPPAPSVDSPAGSGSAGAGGMDAGSAGSAESGSASGSAVAEAGSGSGSAVTETGSGSGSGAKPQGCVVGVRVAIDQLEWDGAGTKGSTPIKDGAFDAEAFTTGLRNARPKPCAVKLGAAPSVPYQLIVMTMDTATKIGFDEISFDLGPGMPGDPNKPSVDPAAEHPASELRDHRVVVVTKTEVRLDGTLVGKVDAVDLAGKLATGLDRAQKARPGDTVILQADRYTTYAVISAVITAATRAGYDKVLFAVKNK